jgi:hypothetical protein
MKNFCFVHNLRFCHVSQSEKSVARKIYQDLSRFILSSKQKSKRKISQSREMTERAMFMTKLSISEKRRTVHANNARNRLTQNRVLPQIPKN